MVEKITVGQLRHALNGLEDSVELEFGGGLTFSNVESFHDGTAVLHFANLEADLTEQTRKRIKVAFCHYDTGDEPIHETSAPRL